MMMIKIGCGVGSKKGCVRVCGCKGVVETKVLKCKGNREWVLSTCASCDAPGMWVCSLYNKEAIIARARHLND